MVLRVFCLTPLWGLGFKKGSRLSPMLFNIYIKLLYKNIQKFKIKCHQHADDT